MKRKDKKQEISIVLKNDIYIEYINIEDLFIELYQIKIENPEYNSYYIRQSDSYGNTEYQVVGLRLETDEEYNERIKSTKKTEDEYYAREKEMYLKLKAKFENE